MSSTSRPTGFNAVAQASRAAAAAATSAGVEIFSVESIEELREVSGLFASVWGRTSEGVPFPSDAMRSLVHAGGLVSAARRGGSLVGGAVLGRATGTTCYSYLAAAVPGGGDRGTGFALKQHQRAWALAEGLTAMHWTFDPLVSRNARFNLSKLGARVRVYEPAFYGQMSDDLNGDDVADRMVAEWALASTGATSASEGTATPLESPAAGALEAATRGPDGEAAWLRSATEAWCRVPLDIVALRRTNPRLASAWREAVAGWIAPALADGFVAISAGPTGWYHLEKENR